MRSALGIQPKEEVSAATEDMPTVLLNLWVNMSPGSARNYV